MLGDLNSKDVEKFIVSLLSMMPEDSRRAVVHGLSSLPSGSVTGSFIPSLDPWLTGDNLKANANIATGIVLSALDALETRKYENLSTGDVLDSMLTGGPIALDIRVGKHRPGKGVPITKLMMAPRNRLEALILKDGIVGASAGKVEEAIERVAALREKMGSKLKRLGKKDGREGSDFTGDPIADGKPKFSLDSLKASLTKSGKDRENRGQLGESLGEIRKRLAKAKEKRLDGKGGNDSIDALALKEDPVTVFRDQPHHNKALDEIEESLRSAKDAIKLNLPDQGRVDELQRIYVKMMIAERVLDMDPALADILRLHPLDFSSIPRFAQSAIPLLGVGSSLSRDGGLMTAMRSILGIGDLESTVDYDMDLLGDADENDDDDVTMGEGEEDIVDSFFKEEGEEWGYDEPLDEDLEDYTYETQEE